MPRRRSIGNCRAWHRRLLDAGIASQVIMPSADDQPCLCSDAIALKLKKGDPDGQRQRMDLITPIEKKNSEWPAMDRICRTTAP
jgi:hypothetical protein